MKSWSAGDAYQLATETNLKKQISLEEEAVDALDGIYNTIYKAASEGRFTCNFPMERTANAGHTATLGKIPIYIIHDDQGSELTPQGKYIESHLKENEYKVYMFGNALEVSWENKKN